MRLNFLPALAAAAILVFAPVHAGAQTRAQSFQEAVNLYENGVYEYARTIFEKIDDPLAGAYAVLCAIRSDAPDCDRLFREFDQEGLSSAIGGRIRYEYASRLFGKKDYAGALALLSTVSEGDIPSSSVAEYRYKRGYSASASGNYDAAIPWFVKLNELPKNSLTAPSRYELGYIAYSRKEFGTAEKWFKLSARDKRFSAISEYYLLECRFNAGDYAYVVKNGPAMMETVPSERRARLARIISESYLVQGDNAQALRYLQMQGEVSAESRADLFHSGSVKYAVGDYAGAVADFSRMKDRSDSLGQIASYELGYSYVRTGNKVAAAEAFADASRLSFDKTIKEDALFNYAKLAFDLNSDTAGFDAYMAAYPSTEKKEQIYNYLAIAALNNHDYASAIEAYSNIDELNPEQKGNFMKANYLRASQLAAGGAWSDAATAFKSAAFYLPKQDRFGQLSRYWQAESLFNSGNYAGAAEIYTDLFNLSALDNRKEGKVLSYNAGCSFYNLKKYETASKWLDIYLASKDGVCRKDALTRRADCDFARHNYKAAATAYGKVLAEYEDANDIYPYYQQGLAYGLSGNKNAKVNVLSKVRKASSEAPLYAEAMYELGRAYMDQENNNMAVSTFEALATSTSDNTFVAKAVIGEGMAYRNMQNYEQAVSCYKRVVDLVPGSEFAEEAVMALNSIYQTTNQPEKFLEYVQSKNLSVGRTDEEKAAVYFNTAEQIYLAGNYAGAEAALLRYLNDYPSGAKRGDAWFYLADSYRNLGRNEKACQAYKQAVEVLGDGSFAESAAYNYARLSSELMHYDEAYEGFCMLERIAKMDENKHAAVLGKAASAFMARKFDKAVEAADSALATPLSVQEEREISFIKAKALLSSSRRAEAFEIFRKLAANPSTGEGAESTYMLIRDYCDSGKYTEMQNAVYAFAEKCGNQTYWLAKSFIVLGDGFREQGNTAQARKTWESILQGYKPSSADDDIIETVNKRIASL